MEELIGPQLRTYSIIQAAPPRPVGIRCRICGLISYHPADITFKFCGNCKIHHGGLSALLTRAVAGEVPPEWWNRFPEIAHKFFDRNGKFIPEKLYPDEDPRPINSAVSTLLKWLPRPPRKSKWQPLKRWWGDGDPGTQAPEKEMPKPFGFGGPDPTAI